MQRVVSFYVYGREDVKEQLNSLLKGEAVKENFDNDYLPEEYEVVGINNLVVLPATVRYDSIFHVIAVLNVRERKGV